MLYKIRNKVTNKLGVPENTSVDKDTDQPFRENGWVQFFFSIF